MVNAGCCFVKPKCGLLSGSISGGLAVKVGTSMLLWAGSNHQKGARHPLGNDWEKLGGQVLRFRGTMRRQVKAGNNWKTGKQDYYRLLRLLLPEASGIQLRLESETTE